MRISIEQARPGDILVFKREGIIPLILGGLIKLTIARNWDFWGWHMAPVVAPDTCMDATWPRLKLSIISELLAAGREIRCYRVFDNPPEPCKLTDYIEAHKGKRYDVIVYLFTALAALLRPRVDVPRVVNLKYTCWECTWDALEYWDFEMCEIPNSNYNYPFITDFLRYVGEIK